MQALIFDLVGALTADDVRAYESRAIAELGRDCARWLASGGRTG